MIKRKLDLGEKIVLLGFIGLVLATFFGLSFIYWTGAYGFLTPVCGMSVLGGFLIRKKSKKAEGIICLITGIVTAITSFIPLDGITPGVITLTTTFFFLRIEPGLILLGATIILTSQDVYGRSLSQKRKSAIRAFPLILLMCFPTSIFLFPVNHINSFEPIHIGEGYGTGISISSEGDYIVWGSYKDLYLYERGDSTPLWHYVLNENLDHASISSDGSYIAIGGGFDDLYLFNKLSSTPLWTTELGDLLRGVVISPDGNYIVAVCNDTVFLLNRTTSTPLWNYNSTNKLLGSVAISSNGTYFAVGGENITYVFNNTSPTPLWNYTTSNAVNSVAISFNGDYIAMGCDGIYLFQRSNSTPIWTYSTEEYINSIDICSEGNYIVAGDRGYNIYFFTRANSTPLWSYTTESWVYSVAISSNGSYIAAKGGTKLYLFEKTGNDPNWIYDEGYSSGIVLITIDGNYVFTSSYGFYIFNRENLYIPDEIMRIIRFWSLLGIASTSYIIIILIIYKKMNNENTKHDKLEKIGKKRT